MKDKSEMQIFLSYGREDEAVVGELYQKLKNDGYKPWQDQKELLPGIEWAPEISKALKVSDLVFVCLSESVTKRTTYVNRELRQALMQFASTQPGAIFIVPISLDGCEVPNLEISDYGLSLQNLQSVDYREADAYDRLLRTLEFRLSQLNH